MSEVGDTPSPRSSSSAPPSSRTPPPAPSSIAETTQSPKKRASVSTEGKITKRRAARACVSCRARKVRCDVVEGAPCGNCRWDDVECIVQESRRRKKNLPYNSNPAVVGARAGSAEALRTKSIGGAPPIIPANLAKPPPFAPNGAFTLPLNGASGAQAATRLLYQQPTGGLGTAGTGPALAGLTGFPPVTSAIPGSAPDFLHPLLKPALEQTNDWPAFIKPLPDKILAEDRQYLVQKQVFTLPPLPLQNALLAAYIEYVHPYMPLMELHDFLRMVNDRSGASGKVSLFLYHAVMFAATAFVDEGLLKDAGYDSRRDARRAFFSRTRLLYDFDYETDRLILVQGLLLMTYWYETPDDQKDTWHWMGVAISLAHTIGLHRDPAKTPMIPRKQKLWKRVWWSCLMRDRLVALGMRRPTRIKSEDFDVPPLTESDFEIEALPEDNQLLGPECALIRDVEMQRELAIMCIEKAKLCMFIGDMLRVQYSVLSRSGVRADQTINSTHMLLPNKNPENMEEVEKVDKALIDWFTSLPECCQHRPLDSMTITDQNKVLAVQRNLLHMIYHTTISALHRPLFLPASPTEGPSTPVEVQETARQRVREAAEHITRMAAELRRRGLERYLPTTGVTVILPAMIVHMLDTKSLVPETRTKAVLGLKECLVVMSNLRNIYAAADFATGFLDALLRKGMLGGPPQQLQPQPQPTQPPSAARSGKMPNRVLAPALNLNPQGLGVAPGMGMMPPTIPERPSTPPPEKAAAASFLSSTSLDNPSPFGYTTQTLDPGSVDGYLITGSTPVGGVGAATPPHTDSEDVATPPPSTQGRDQDIGDADVAMADQIMLEHTTMNGDGGVGNAGAGPNAGTGNNFDFDQWLQFPAEGGLNTSDNDTFMGGMFGSEQAGMELGGDHGWMGNLPEGISH
ncbi:fungal-specific transcription factor domain-containing protein [Achaetomium macrosporum]|uniref:Fungal-specific transcription factor domain-containing protein n=1 Tax=Achaetomium macrosporum TaxID=79813 RepID=A0AAN7CAH6_9PEZI|nr:fungal-specific transcription factor domain-containing protein [Achaetomium macrosporum]